MGHYFHDIVTPEELAKLQYVPTMPEFLEKIKSYDCLPAITEDNKTVSYAELCNEVALRRDFIASLGLPKGSHIAILDHNSLDAIELFLAITSAGHVSMFLPTALPAPAIQGITMKFALKAIFAGDDFKAVCEGLPIPVLAASSTGTKPAPCAEGIKKADPAAIYFTGGSTGAPKGAVLSHGAYLRGCLNGAFAPTPVVGCLRTICLLPFSHVFGSIKGMGSILTCGGHLFASRDIKASIGMIPVIKPNMLTLVPGMAEMLLGIVKLKGIGFLGGQLRYIISGAANVPARSIRSFYNLGISLMGGYGLTESANFVSGNIDIDTRPTSVGKIYPELETKVVDGELWIKGDCVFTEYYNDPVQTAAAFEDGWFKTGDLVRFDECGYLYITGRCKNIIVLSNGENVSPESIEEEYYKFPYIKDVLVREEMVGDEPCIAIHMLPLMPAFEGKTHEEIEAVLKQTVDQVNAATPSTHNVSLVHIRYEDFPRTGALKIDRNKLPR